MRPVTIIGNASETLKRIRTGLRCQTLNAVREVLSDALIDQACRETGLIFRKRILTPPVTLLHLVMAALWPEESFAAAWQVMWDALVSRQPDAAGESPNSASLAKARGRLPLEVTQWLFEQLVGRCAHRGEEFDLWRGRRVVLLDGTCVSMSDEDELMKAFGTSRTGPTKGRYPLARVVAACAMSSRTVLGYSMGRYGRSENALSWPVLEKLRKGDLVVSDRRFAGAAIYARQRAMGLEFLTRMHQRVKVSNLKRLVEFGPDDFITEMTVWPPYRREDPTLPETVRVRMIRSTATIRGKKTTLWLVTSLLDAARYPAEEIRPLYGMRWRIETLFEELKVTLSADVLRSKTVDGVLQEMAARMLTLNVVRTIVVEAALKAKVRPEQIGFVHAVRAVVIFSGEMATTAAWKLPEIYEAMLKEIATHRIPHRPGRNEPRAVRRDPKHYPTLRITRRLWRLTQIP